MRKGQIKWNIVLCSLVQIYWFCGGLCYCHMKDWIGCVIFLCLRSWCCRIWTAFFFLIIIIIIVIVVFARLHNRWLLTSTEINRGCHSWQGWICNFKVLSFITQKFQWLLWKDLGWLLVVFNFSKNQRQKFDEFLP